MFGFGKKRDDDDEETSSHAAAAPSDCQRMAKNNHWKLVDVRPNGSSKLPVDCIFKGKTTFDDYHDRD